MSERTGSLFPEQWDDDAPAPGRRTHPLLEVLGRACADTGVESSEVWDSYIVAPDVQRCPHKLDRTDGQPSLCRKSSAGQPLGVCSVATHDNQTVITCPHRFEQHGVIFDDIFEFLTANHPDRSAVERSVDAEVRLSTTDARPVGNADFVVAATDPNTGQRTLCSVEVQATYNSGATRRLFETFITGAAQQRHELTDDTITDRPVPDFLSSWKRLRSQLLDKGPGLAAANVKQAVIVDQWFLNHVARRLHLDTWADIEVPAGEADVALFAYDLAATDTGQLQLTRTTAVHTTYDLLGPLLQQGGTLDVAALTATLDARLAARRSTLALQHQQTLIDAPG